MIKNIIILLLVLIIAYLLRTNDKQKDIRTLIRQASRWSVAADQDENAMIAVLHANYGAGYLWALQDIATDNEIASTGVDHQKFKDEIIRIQDNATRNMARLCPDFAPKTGYLTSLSGEGV